MKTIFLRPSNLLLKAVAQEIPKDQIDSKNTQKIIKTMLNVAYGNQKNKKKPIMVGLAAPQIGISKRIILVDIKADGKGKTGELRVYINPEITYISKSKKKWYEGCYSTGKICGIVQRPTSIKIKAFNPEGILVEEKHKDYIARIFQHEIDHLNGKIFIDLIKDPNNLHWVEKTEFPLYRNKEAWRNWPKKHPLPLASLKLKKV